MRSTPRAKTSRIRRLALAPALGAALVAGACSIDFGEGSGLPEPSEQPRVVAPDDVDFAFGDVADSVSISPLLFGTNVPAWVNPSRTAEPWFATAVRESGVTLLRFPGGSWSNWYEWHECMDGTDGCYWTWALKPQDFAQVIVDTGLPAMWTASINATAQANAALVAFFNGDVDDERTIGVDRDGVDWQTVGHWARRRADFGFESPVRVDYWEIGNEVYGAVADAGPQCAEWGWEEVWTCDGTDYMVGDGANDGFNDIAAAMRVIDPTIRIGAVGVSPTDEWSAFGREVLEAGVGSLDFYVVHTYAFGGPFDTADVLDAHLRQGWADDVADVAMAANDAGFASRPPIAITEYNLVAWWEADEAALMPTMYNLFHLVGSLGEMAAAGVEIATEWAFVSGEHPNGSDYGVIHADDHTVYPSFFAHRLWALMGDRLIAVSDHPDLVEYAAIDADGVTSLLLSNPGAAPVAVTVAPPGGMVDVTAHVVEAATLDARSVTYNGVPIGSIDDLVGVEPLALGAADLEWGYEVPARSVVVLRFAPS